MTTHLSRDHAHPLRGEYVNTRQIAERIGISASFLNKARITGGGPPFIKAGKSVRYHWPAVEEWLRGRTRRNTSEQTAA